MLDFVRIGASATTTFSTVACATTCQRWYVVRGRTELLAENALLPQQLIAAQRKINGRVRWAPWQSKRTVQRYMPQATTPRGGDGHAQSSMLR